MTSKKDETSATQLVTPVVTEEYLKERAAAANQQAFVAALQKVPKATPSDEDKLP